MKGMNYSHVLKASIVFVLVAFQFTAEAQFKSKKNKKTASPAAVAPAKPGGVEDFDKKVKGLEKIDGLFAFYRDTTSGSLYMAINKQHLNEHYIYFTYTENGPVNTGHYRGNFRETKVFSITKYYNRVEFATQNNTFYFDTLSALYKSKDANVIPGMIVSEKIVAESKDGQQFLISADNIFLKESFHQVKPSTSPVAAMLGMYSLGSLNPAKTRYEKIKSYPENSDIVVKYVYDDPSPRSSAGSFVAENRVVEVVLQHSIIAIPRNSFKPRFDDPRVGYFTTQTNDMTSFDAVNYRDYIHRWHLEKKDPTLAISEPVEPIVYWIENTTPVEYRDVIEKALLAWNISFEKAGFKNAIVVKTQPDDAEWDAGDIRYNVIRWTSSPAPPFGGYGPSFVNPLTGQIIGADIMLEFVFLTGRLSKEKLFELAAMPMDNPMEFIESLYAGELSHNGEQHACAHGCEIGANMQRQFLFGTHAHKALGASEDSLGRFLEEALFYLVLHEVGHTLGLTHNMRASQYLSPAELQNIEITREKGVIASVMDYPALNFANEPGKIVQQYNTKPGPYDDWAIIYGYSSALEGDDSERNRLEQILARSTEPALRYGNDADDMRAPGKGIDPRVNVFDLSSDAIGFASDRMKLIEKVMGLLTEKYVEEGKSYHELRNAFFALSGEYASMGDIVSRYIGGVYAERQFAGQDPGTKPLTATPLETQKRAMDVLINQVFAPNALQMNDSLIPYLQPQRRGFGFFRVTEDPKMHDRFLQLQIFPLAHLLAPTTMKRISDSRLYGNEYTLNMLFADLQKGIFTADIKSAISTKRQNLQIQYVKLLDSRLNGPFGTMYDNLSIAAMHNAAQDLKKLLSANVAVGNEESKSHKRYVLYLVEELLEKSKK